MDAIKKEKKEREKKKKGKKITKKLMVLALCRVSPIMRVFFFRVFGLVLAPISLKRSEIVQDLTTPQKH